MKKQVYTKTVDDFIKPELTFHLFGEGAPRVFFTGGIHGGEATGIYVAQRVIEFLEENELLKGSVKVLPIANPTAFRHLERSSPYDRLDLNRIFPGRTGSAPSLGVADLIWAEAQDADYIVDLHCCGVWGSSYTLAVYPEFDFARELAGMLAIPRGRGGGHPRAAVHQRLRSGYSSGDYRAARRRPGWRHQSGGGGGMLPGVNNLLRQLGMVAGGLSARTRFLRQAAPGDEPGQGAFIPRVKPVPRSRWVTFW